MTISPTSICANLNTQENTDHKNLFVICNRLKVMRNQEETTYSCSDYLNETAPSDKMIDQICRDKMCNWISQLVNFTQIKEKTVYMSMMYLDRFLSSGSKPAVNSIHNREDYQLATMTSLYLASKLHDPIKFSIPMFIHICNDTRSPDQFTKMENDVLEALNWRLNGPTTLCFLEHFFDIIPPEMFSTSTLSTRRTVLKTLFGFSKLYAKQTTNDYYFVPMKPSTVAICCISVALQRIPPFLFDKSDQEALFYLISSHANIDLKSLDVKKGSKRLKNIVMNIPENESESIKPPIQQWKKGTNDSSSSSFKSTSTVNNSSPVCVSQ